MSERPQAGFGGDAFSSTLGVRVAVGWAVLDTGEAAERGGAGFGVA